MRYGAAPGILTRVRGKRRHRKGGVGRLATSALPAPPVNPTVLGKEFFGEHVPKTEQYRTHYGKALDLWRIDYAIQQAEQGAMREMTDISRETASLDGHLSSTLQKRLNRLAALPWDIQPATGEGIDGGRADAYARYVRDQVDQIPRFREAITSLAWAVFDARAASELGWAHRGADWAVKGLYWVHPRRISFGSRRDLRVVDPQQQSTTGFRDVGFALEDRQLPYKFITYKPRLFGDYPEREGLAPRCLYWSRFARYAMSSSNMLLELFGRPWRVIKVTPGADPSWINDESVKSAFATAQSLNADNVARLPPGFDLDVIQPFTGAGQVSGDIMDRCQKVISKLILGNTGTTDAVSTGLGSTIGDAHVSEEDLIIASDALRLAETIEDMLTDAIIAVNFGPEEVSHAPRFLFRTEPPVSRADEVTRIKGALEIGLRVSETEAMERLGVREIKDDEPYLVRVQRPAGAFGVLPPASELVYPVGHSPTAGEVAPAPDVGFTLPAGGDEGPPLATPPAGLLPAGDDPALTDGAPPLDGLGPDVDEPDAIAALCEQMNELGVLKCPHGRSNRCPLCSIEVERSLEGLDSSGEPEWKVIWKPIREPAIASAKDAWLTLLGKRRPELSPDELDAIGRAPLDELRLMVGVTEHPPDA